MKVVLYDRMIGNREPVDALPYRDSAGKQSWLDLLTSKYGRIRKASKIGENEWEVFLQDGRTLWAEVE